jgi:hypothetical protein
MPNSSARIYVVLAREAPVAVVFRRGPSRQVQLIEWNTANDTFEPGQWFKGRIYERRCDLSPSGKHLIYFAANHKPPYGTWTAVSRPPFLTALALWPKGDAWGGGGLFEKENVVLLNHPAYQMQLAEGFSLPRKVRVKQCGFASGGGEDSPVFDIRLRRDGWRRMEESKLTRHGSKAKLSWTYDPPLKWAKTNPVKSHELQMLIHGVHQRDGAWYLVEHILIDKTSGASFSLGPTDWADWDRNGDLLFAKDGELFRLSCARGKLGTINESKLLIDLNGQKFSNVPASAEAIKWSL